MQQQIVVQGRTLTTTVQTPLAPAVLSVMLTPVDHPALHCDASSKGALIQGIDLTCKCTGDWVTGTSTFVGTGTGTISASTPRVQCEGQSMLTLGDAVSISCPGTITVTAGGATSLGTAKVTVTITGAGQVTVDANKA